MLMGHRFNSSVHRDNVCARNQTKYLHVVPHNVHTQYTTNKKTHAIDMRTYESCTQAGTQINIYVHIVVRMYICARSDQIIRFSHQKINPCVCIDTHTIQSTQICECTAAILARSEITRVLVLFVQSCKAFACVFIVYVRSHSRGRLPFRIGFKSIYHKHVYHILCMELYAQCNTHTTFTKCGKKLCRIHELNCYVVRRKRHTQMHVYAFINIFISVVAWTRRK